MLQQTDIVGKAVGALCDLRKNAEYVIVEFTGIGLSRHAVHALVSHFFHDFFLQQFDFFAVAVEEIEKTCLRARRTLDAAQFDGGFEIHQRNVVHFQIFQPQRRALSYSRQLGRL